MDELERAERWRAYLSHDFRSEMALVISSLKLLKEESASFSDIQNELLEIALRKSQDCLDQLDEKLRLWS